MGIYINPVDMGKDEWLAIHGRYITQEAAEEFKWQTDFFVVCLVDNGGFNAAAVMFSEGELNYFLVNFKVGSKDPRPVCWYLVRKPDLDKVLEMTDWVKVSAKKGKHDGNFTETS